MNFQSKCWQDIFCILETLSKYGAIDILFGFGIIATIFNAFKSKTVDEIEGIDIIPQIDVEKSKFVLQIKNQSPEPLYLYRGYIEVGYFGNAQLQNKFQRWIANLLYTTWQSNIFKGKVLHRKTTRGFYVLQSLEADNRLAPSLFIRQYCIGSYYLDLDLSSFKDTSTLNDIFENHNFGIFTIDFVHGTKSGKLKAQL